MTIEFRTSRLRTPDELRDLIENDLALLLTERFAISQAEAAAPAAAPAAAKRRATTCRRS